MPSGVVADETLPKTARRGGCSFRKSNPGTNSVWRVDAEAPRYEITKRPQRKHLVRRCSEPLAGPRFAFDAFHISTCSDAHSCQGSLICVRRYKSRTYARFAFRLQLRPDEQVDTGEILATITI